MGIHLDKPKQILVKTIQRKYGKHPKFELKCPKCDINFIVNWEHRKRTFCSQDCNYGYKNRTEKIKCANPECEILVEKRITELKRKKKEGKLTYCGYSCSSKNTRKLEIESGKFFERYTPEYRKMLSKNSSGENNGMYGKHHSKETRKKISEANTGHVSHIKGLTWNEFYGEERANAISKKLSATKKEYFETHDHHNKGKKFEEIYGEERSKELKEKFSSAQKKYFKTHISFNTNKSYDEIYGKEKSKQVRKKISDTRLRKGLGKGKLNGMYIDGNAIGGGVVYGHEFTNELKMKIRKRDYFTCAVCKKKQSVHVHHIDYDKFNNIESNLITLCHSCHNKTNSPRKRNSWTLFFENYMTETSYV